MGREEIHRQPELMGGGKGVAREKKPHHLMPLLLPCLPVLKGLLFTFGSLCAPAPWHFPLHQRSYLMGQVAGWQEVPCHRKGESPAICSPRLPRVEGSDATWLQGGCFDANPMPERCVFCQMSQSVPGFGRGGGGGERNPARFQLFTSFSEFVSFRQITLRPLRKVPLIAELN